MPLYGTEPSDLEGINTFYDEEIRPTLGMLERRHTAAVFRAHAIILILVPTLVGLTAYYATNEPFAVISGVFPLIFAAVMVPLRLTGFFLPTWLVDVNYRAVRRIKQQHKVFLLSKLSDFLDLEYSKTGSKKQVKGHQKAGVLPACNDIYCEDQLSGEQAGLAFVFSEAHLVEEGQDWFNTDLLVFRGALITIETSKKIDGHVVVHCRSAKVPPLSFTPYDLVRLEDVKFMRVFEVFASDQITARYVLTPSVMERLLAMQSAHGDLRASFRGQTLHIAYSTEDRFEAGHLLDDLDDPEHVRAMITDLLGVKRLAAAVGEIAEVRA